MFLVCRVVARGKVVVPDIIKEADEGLSFAAFFLSNFDSKYSLLEVHIADDGCGKNSVQTELQHPLKVALTFGKTHVKFIVSDTVIYSKLQLSGGSIRLLQGISVVSRASLTSKESESGRLRHVSVPEWNALRS